jgi:orotate phosphoribosyltransferase
MPDPTPPTDLSKMDVMDEATLAAQIRDAALLEGDFTLRSGKKSRYYLDKYRFETKPAILAQLGVRLAGFVDDGVDRLAGPELGGIPLVVAASLASGKPALLVRGEAKGYGTSNRIEGVFEPGERVMLVEDVVTSGGAVLSAAEVAGWAETSDYEGTTGLLRRVTRV